MYSYSINFSDYNNDKIGQIKFLRSISGMGLKESKDAVENSRYNNINAVVRSPFDRLKVNDMAVADKVSSTTSINYNSSGKELNYDKPLLRTIGVTFLGDAPYHRIADCHKVLDWMCPYGINVKSSKLNLNTRNFLQVNCGDDELTNCIASAGFLPTQVHFEHFCWGVHNDVVNPYEEKTYNMPTPKLARLMEVTLKFGCFSMTQSVLDTDIPKMVEKFNRGIDALNN